MFVLCLLNREIGKQRRYIEAMEGYFSGLISQVDMNSSAERPDIETHIAIRSETIGVKPALAFTESVTPTATRTSETDCGETC